MKKIVIDLDNTITKGETKNYEDASPNYEIINQMKKYKKNNFSICIFTSRNMRTFSGDIEKIKSNTLPIILKWLDKYNVPYDEIIIGKPWCGFDGFYVDDKAIRPSEFINLSYNQIKNLLNTN